MIIMNILSINETNHSLCHGGYMTCHDMFLHDIAISYVGASVSYTHMHVYLYSCSY